jgi:hypothetical protein
VLSSSVVPTAILREAPHRGLYLVQVLFEYKKANRQLFIDDSETVASGFVMLIRVCTYPSRRLAVDIDREI